MIPNAMAPSESPVNQPVGAAPGPQGGPGIVINQNNNGMATKSQFDSSVNEVLTNGSRQTATVGGSVGMQP